jgi:predicted ATPase
MLTSLSIGNFKSWEKLDNLSLGKVTLLFGENSSGKTSLIQSLLLLKQTAESYDRAQPLNLGTRETYVDLGMYEDLIYGHELKRMLSFGFDWTEPNGEKTKLSTSFSYRNNALCVINLTMEHERITTSLTRGPRGAYEFSFKGQKDTKLGKTKELAPIKFYGFPKLVTQKYPELSDLSLKVEELASRIYYLGPLRVQSAREYTWSGSAPEGVGKTGVTAVQAILARAFEREAMKRADKESIIDIEASTQKWLKKLGLADTFAIESIGNSRQYKAVIKTPDYEHEANVLDVGVGVSQVLPIIILAHYAPKGSIILLEQPEIHLHPLAQANLAEMFFEVAQERDIQFIIETHSEHLLTRLQRRVAEGQDGKMTNEDIKLYVCKRNKQVSTIEKLDFDEDGRIKNWPPNFFGDTLSDREAIMRAFINKRKNKSETT